MSRRRNHRHSVGIDKSLVLKIGAGVFAIVGILGALLGTGYMSTSSQCKEAGFGGAASIDTCRTDSAYTYDKVAIVVGNTANSPKPALSDELTKYLKNSLLTNPKMEVAIISATPSHSVMSYEPTEVKDASNSQVLLKAINKEVDKVADTIQSAPKENGSEYLEAILNAVRAVQNRQGRSLILVIGSGLSDSAPLDFSNNGLLNKTSSEVLKAYRNSRGNSLPLYNVDLVWYGLGSTTAPQQELDSNIKDLLLQHYDLILSEMGIHATFDNSIFSGDSIETKYTVKTTQVKTSSLKFEEKFDDTSALSFNANTTTFRDGDSKAWLALEQSGIIEQIKANSNLAITVNGYVAVNCNGDVDIELAQGRADAVRNLLISHGIINSIVAKGIGQTEEAKRSHICIENSTQEQLQEQRVVVITGKEI